MIYPNMWRRLYRGRLILLRGVERVLRVVVLVLCCVSFVFAESVGDDFGDALYLGGLKGHLNLINAQVRLLGALDRLMLYMLMWV